MTTNNYTITEQQVTQFDLPEYANEFAADHNGTFTDDWVFNKSNYNNVISNTLREGGDELRNDGIKTLTSLEEVRALKILTTLEDTQETVELIDDDDELTELLEDIELEFFYELDETDEIKMDDFIELLRKSGLILKEDDIKKVFLSLDKNGNGILEYIEVKNFIEYVRRKQINKRRGIIEQNKTEKKTVNVDTRFRSDYYNTTSSMFNYEIPEIQKNVTNIKIGSIEMPVTNYNISEKLNNNTFLIISDANTRVVEYDVSGSWRLHMQIGDISSDYLFGTITENTNINVVDTSQAAIPGFVLGNGPSYNSDISYSPNITPIKDVTFIKSQPPSEYDEKKTETLTDYTPLKAHKLNKFTSLSDVVANDVSDNYRLYRKRNLVLQYSRIIKDVSFAHPENGVLQTYDFGEIPGSVKTKISKISSNGIETTTTDTITTKYYNFIKYRWCKWKEGVWNGLDGNHSTEFNGKGKVLYTETVTDAYPTVSYFRAIHVASTRPSSSLFNDVDIIFKPPGVLTDDWYDTKRINIYSPRGNPRRNDISFENLTYLDGSVILPPYDCSMMYERTKETSVKQQIHLKALKYTRLQDNKEFVGFEPKQSAWLVKLPDGNYDETWNNKNARFERIVNDAINIATPGAVDEYGNFAAIIDPQEYDFLNSDTIGNSNNIISRNSIFFKKQGGNITNLEPFEEGDLRFSIDRISKRSLFAASTDDNDPGIFFRTTKVNKFFIRESQSGLRTIFGNYEDWSNNYTSTGEIIGHPRQGELYPEMASLLSNSREPKINTKIMSSTTKNITTLRFNVDNYGNQDVETNIQHKLGWILGFRTSEYNFKTSQTNHNISETSIFSVESENESESEIESEKNKIKEITLNTPYSNLITNLENAESIDESDSNAGSVIQSINDDIESIVEDMKADAEQMEEVASILKRICRAVLENAFYFKYNSDPNIWYFHEPLPPYVTPPESGRRVHGYERNERQRQDLVNNGIPKYDNTKNENFGIILKADLAIEYCIKYVEDMQKELVSSPLDKKILIKNAKISLKAFRGWLGCKENFMIIQDASKSIKTRSEVNVGTGNSGELFELTPFNNWPAVQQYQYTQPNSTQYRKAPFGNTDYADSDRLLTNANPTSNLVGLYFNGSLDPYNFGYHNSNSYALIKFHYDNNYSNFDEMKDFMGRYFQLTIKRTTVETAYLYSWIWPSYNTPVYSHFHSNNVANLNNYIQGSGWENAHLYASTQTPKIGIYDDSVNFVTALRAAKAIRDWVPPSILPAKTKVLSQDNSDYEISLIGEWDRKIKDWDTIPLYDISYNYTLTTNSGGGGGNNYP